MRCLVCEAWSWQLVCKGCQRRLLVPTLTSRKLVEDFEVYSFYGYSEIRDLLLTKHSWIGAEIFRILVANSLKPFAQNLKIEAFAIGIDDRPKKHYSHTAILARGVGSSTIKPLYGKLRATNDVSYHGKDLAYRLSHPRGFRYTGPIADLVLVDDIVTTGTTLKEAYNVCKAAGARPLFALTLADARE